ncbi:MAG: hypothetical protein AAGI28_14575 [Pseudomonadota bacterium]
MATIRKPNQSEFDQKPAAKAARKAASEAGEIGSAISGGIADTLITLVLFPAVFIGLWHGPFILLGGDIAGGIVRIIIGGVALYVLANRFKRKREAGREKQLGRAMAKKPAPANAQMPSATQLPREDLSGQSHCAPSYALAPSTVRYSREALMPKLIWCSLAAFCFGYLSFSEFGFMFVLALFFAFRAVVLLLNVVSPSVCLKLSETDLESTDLVGINTKMRWHDVASISHSEEHFLKQHFSLRYGSRKFVQLLGFDAEGQERILRVPYKALSLEADDIMTLIEKAQNNELAGGRPRASATTPQTPTQSAKGLPVSDLPEVRASVQAGFGRKGL